jgi:hypothetical protein
VGPLTLPPHLDWIGWLGATILIVGYFVVRYYFLKKQAEPSLNGLSGPYGIDGFADCHYPEDLAEWKTELLKLVDIRDNVFEHCAMLYSTTEEWIVPKLALVYDTLDETHPNVFWSRSAGRIVLEVQDDMYWHFAGEVHNVFRFGMYGPGSDRTTYSPQDCRDAAMIQKWIRERYKENDN